MLNGTRWPNDRSTLRPRDDPKKLGAGVGDAWWPTLENAIWGVRGVMVRDAIPLVVRIMFTWCTRKVVMSLGAVPGHVAGWTRGAIPPSSAVLIQRACLEHRICESTHKGKLQEKVPEAFS